MKGLYMIAIIGNCFTHRKERMDSKIWTALFLICFEVIEISTLLGCLNDNILERFLYKQKGKKSTQSEDSYLEFLVIGKSVSWYEAEAFCPSYAISKSRKFRTENLEPEARIALEFETNDDKKTIPDIGSKLAVIDDVKIKNWLARMLSESDYQYDGLWIGGYKKKSSDNWTWIGEKSYEDSTIPETVLVQNYPAWLNVLKKGAVEKRCLLFNRLGHDLPVFQPEDCYLRRPFVCVQVGRKSEKYSTEQIANVTVDGYRYTLYGIVDNKNHNNFDQVGIRKLNGGGIKWKNARLECRMRGQQLAMVLTNEATSAIAEVMLKSRPSVESAWLGGWSLDGSEWTWVTLGSSLSSKKSSTTSYPPWLEGRPIINENKFDNEDLGMKSRCLVLDRHVCPEHIRPVFLDLDCDKERPFICQNGIVELRGNFEDQDRDIILSDKKLQFSAQKMNWNEGDEYCKKNNGHISSIYDSKILSIVLSKMTELSLDHVWIGGHTKKFGNDWKWVDEKDNVLSRKGVGITSSWCLQSDKSGSLLKADPETCLNLDREGHGLPLFYGLPCDIIQQHVLCNIPLNSTLKFSLERENTDPYLNGEDPEDLEDNDEEISPRFLIPSETTESLFRNLSYKVKKKSLEERKERTTISYNNEEMTTIESTLSVDFSDSETFTLESKIVSQTEVGSN